MSTPSDDLDPSTLQPPRPEHLVYKRDFQSVQKMVLRFKSTFEQKILTPTQFNAYYKQVHDLQLLLNSFMLNSFEMMPKTQIISCLRNWESLIYDQNQKAKHMLKKYLDSENRLNQRSNSISQKVLTTCERCYLDKRKVNIQEIKNYLDSEYMGMLNRMIYEAKMEINGQLFTQEEDKNFFQQLHNILKKKNENIEFNNKSIENLIDKITKEISDINFMKNMAIKNSPEIQPPSYAWMRNIKSALNDLLQSTFKNKVPGFIQNMVRLFEQHQKQRNRNILRSEEVQTDDFESVQINGLKEKVHKMNGVNFKLQNDLKWVENELENQKKQIKAQRQKLQKEIQNQWKELIEERQINKRLKAAFQNVIKQTAMIKEELRKKSMHEKRQQKTAANKELQKQKPKQKVEFNLTNTSVQPKTTQQQAINKNPSLMQLNQRFNQGQEQRRQKPLKIMSKSNLFHRKSVKNNAQIESKTLTKKVSEITVQLNQGKSSDKILERQVSNKKDNTQENCQEQNYRIEREQSKYVKFQHENSETNGLDINQDRIEQSCTKISSQKQCQEYYGTKLNLMTGKSIVLEEEGSQFNQNQKSTQNDQNKNEMQALQQIRKSLNKSIRGQNQNFSNHFQRFDSFENSKQENLNHRDSQIKSSMANTNSTRKYNEEVLRVNELMEKRIKRSNIMTLSKLPKYSQFAKTQNKIFSQLVKDEQKIDENLEQESKVYPLTSHMRKHHLRSQTMLDHFKFKSPKDSIQDLNDQKAFSKERNKFCNTFAGKIFRDIDKNSLIENHQSNPFSIRQAIDPEELNSEIEQLIKNLIQKIQITTSDSVDGKQQFEINAQLKSMMLNFLQKYGSQLKYNQFSLQKLISFQETANKSVSFRENEPLKHKEAVSTNCSSKTPYLPQCIPTEQKILPRVTKTCMNTPKNPGMRSIKTSNHTQNALKRDLRKSLPDQQQPKNQISLERNKLEGKVQRSLLKDIKNYGHKRYGSCQIQSHQVKKSNIKVDIFTKQDFDLFIDEANAYSYECAHMKRQPKPLTSPLTSEYQTLINSIFTDMEKIREVNMNFYNQIASFIRYPYQTINNLIWGACIIKRIKFESFEKYMERIIYLHRKCPISPENGCCMHLTMFRKKIESIKHQALRLAA